MKKIERLEKVRKDFLEHPLLKREDHFPGRFIESNGFRYVLDIFYTDKVEKCENTSGNFYHVAYMSVDSALKEIRG